MIVGIHSVHLPCRLRDVNFYKPLFGVVYDPTGFWTGGLPYRCRVLFDPAEKNTKFLAATSRIAISLYSHCSKPLHRFL